jgi:inosose dehydratase
MTDPEASMPALTRREFLAVAAGGASWCASDVLAADSSPAAAGSASAAAGPGPSGSEPAVTFSFGTYGMRDLDTAEALALIADTGYDGVELCVRPEWDAAPERLSTDRRRDVRGRLRQSGLKLTALMEHVQPSEDDTQSAAVLERLNRASALGHDLSPGAPPLIQTTLGGGRWDDVKTLYVDRLARWADLGRRAETVIAIKPHRGGALSQPAEAVWLIEQLDRTPWLRMVYDYSHYAFRDLPLEATVRTALPYTAHVAIKDAVRAGERVEFTLPGASGTFDYSELFRLLKAGGYAGDVCCEVSGMVWDRPEYDPRAAARTCYANIAPAFEAAELRRARRTSPQLRREPQ